MTKRHLTFFEMLGNFSVGDYFKREAVEWALELATSPDGFGLDFESHLDNRLRRGRGARARARTMRRSSAGAPWACPTSGSCCSGREDNFWQSGPTGPCGPCSELYYDRGPGFGPDSDRPGDDTERLLEIWNLVFMQYELQADGSLPELPTKNIDTGMGLERMSAVMQEVDSVYETDLFQPLIGLGEELSGRRYGQDFATTRALRILADHGRGAAFLLSDGVVPSNEDRGYILRRIMRRTIQQGHVLGIEGSFLPRLYRQVVDGMKDAYPELERELGDDRALGAGRGGELSAHPRAGRAAARRAGRGGQGRADLLGVRRGRLQAARHLWLPLRDDQGAAGRPRPVGGRPGLRGAHGARPRGIAGRLGRPAEGGSRRRWRPRQRRARGRAALRPRCRLSHALRRLRDHRGGHRPARGRAGQRLDPGQAGRESFLPRGRRPGVRRRDRGDALRPGARGATCTGSATTRRSPSSRSTARSGRARAHAHWWSATRGSPRCATTPPRIFCTLRCASGSATTCVRRAPTWGRTSCASTSPTASG